MGRVTAAALGVPAGYLIFAFGGYWAIELLSSNAFDWSVEATMTAAFFAGPAGAIIGLVAGLLLGGRKPVPK